MLTRAEYEVLKDMEARQIELVNNEKDYEKRQKLALGLRFIYRELQTSGYDYRDNNSV